MRNIYSDEAGTSAHETISVVVALVIHADTQWRPLVEEMNSLIRHHVPMEFRDGFVFHVKDLVDKDKYPGWEMSKRYVFVRTFMRLPRRFNICLCFGVTKRGTGIKQGEITGLKKFELDHLYAFIIAMTWADKYLRQYCGDSLAQVITEEHNLKKPLRKYAQETRKSPLKLLTRKRRLHEEEVIDVVEENRLERVIDEIHFADAEGSPILQIADACAFGLRRFFAKFDYGLSYLDEIMGEEYFKDKQRDIEAVWDFFADMRVFDITAPIY